jgi:hypothetical protein
MDNLLTGAAEFQGQNHRVTDPVFPEQGEVHVIYVPVADKPRVFDLSEARAARSATGQPANRCVRPRIKSDGGRKARGDWPATRERFGGSDCPLQAIKRVPVTRVFG